MKETGCNPQGICSGDFLFQVELKMTQLERAMKIKAERGNGDYGCSMCGRFCANDMLKGMFEDDMKGSDKR